MNRKAFNKVRSLAPGETWRHDCDDVLAARRLDYFLRKCFSNYGYYVSQYRHAVIVTRKVSA